MPLPAGWALITVTGTFLDREGTPMDGFVHFHSGQVVVVGGTIVVPKTITAELDENGSFEVELPSTDDPDLNVTGWAYTVEEDFEGGRTYSIFVEYNGGDIDLATVSPVTPPATQTGLATSVQLNALEDRVEALEADPGVTDHGDLTGLDDDDHPQYLNNARGDARYDAIGDAEAAQAAAEATAAAALSAHEAASDPHPGYVLESTLGVSVATLVAGTIPAGQLPSYVDDVIEAADFASLPVTGEAGKIYVVLDPSPNKQYRWSGSAYVEIVPSPGSTDALAEGATNKYFTEARVLATVLTGLSLLSSADVSASDTILQAIGRLQGQATEIRANYLPLTLNAEKVIVHDGHSLVFGHYEPGFGADLRLRVSRGTPDSPLAVQNNDIAGGFYGHFHDGTSYVSAGYFELSVDAGAISTGVVPVMASMGGSGGWLSIFADGHAQFSGDLQANNLSGTNTGDQDLSGYALKGSANTFTAQNTFAAGTLTDSAPHTWTQTWNDAADTFTALKLNVTDTNSAAASLLLDLQVGGASKAKISKTGVLTLAAGTYNAPNLCFGSVSNAITDYLSGLYFVANGNNVAYIKEGLRFKANGLLEWNDQASFAVNSSDLKLGRRAAAQPCWGGADSATPVAQTITFQGARGGTDTNTAAVAATIQGSLGTGTGTVGDLVFKTGTVAASGTTQHTADTRLTLNSAGATFTTSVFAPNGSRFAVRDGSNNGAHIQSNGVRMGNGTNNCVAWTNGLNTGTPDTGLGRDTAGVVEVNNGLTGNFRDIKVRDIIIDSGTLAKSSTAFTNGAAAALGTLTNAPVAGDPTKWVPINDNGTTRYIPAW